MIDSGTSARGSDQVLRHANRWNSAGRRGRGPARVRLDPHWNGMVVHRFRRQRVMAVAFDLVAERADHLRMADIAAFADIDVAARPVRAAYRAACPPPFRSCSGNRTAAAISTMPADCHNDQRRHQQAGSHCVRGSQCLDSSPRATCSAFTSGRAPSSAVSLSVLLISSPSLGRLRARRSIGAAIGFSSRILPRMV